MKSQFELPIGIGVFVLWLCFGSTWGLIGAIITGLVAGCLVYDGVIAIGKNLLGR